MPSFVLCCTETFHTVKLPSAGLKLGADRSSVHTAVHRTHTSNFPWLLLPAKCHYGGNAIAYMLMCSKCRGSRACCTCWTLHSRGRLRLVDVRSKGAGFLTSRAVQTI